jgi:hypothetical protein
MPPHRLCYTTILFHTMLPPPHTHLILLGNDENCLDCTPDELAALVREIRDNSVLIGTHTYRLVSYKNTFVGRQLVDWLIAKKGYKSKSHENLVVPKPSKGQPHPIKAESLKCLALRTRGGRLHM